MNTSILHKIELLFLLFATPIPNRFKTILIFHFTLVIIIECSNNFVVNKSITLNLLRNSSHNVFVLFVAIPGTHVSTVVFRPVSQTNITIPIRKGHTIWWTSVQQINVHQNHRNSISKVFTTRSHRVV